jgi:hypothetical protein
VESLGPGWPAHFSAMVSNSHSHRLHNPEQTVQIIDWQ